MTTRRRAVRPVAVVLASGLLLAACSSSTPTPGPSSVPPSTSAPASGSLPAMGPGSPAGSVTESAPASASALAPSLPASLSSPATGVVVSVDSTGLSKVSGFTLRLPDGTRQAFRIGVLENGAQFPPGHLTEHVASSAPVRVYFRPAGGELVVYRIEDAG